MPHVTVGDGRDIGFLLPIFTFGGVEKVVFNYAAAMRAQGWRPHLFITGTSSIQPYERHFDVFESVNFFEGDGIEGGDYSKLHLGACVSGFALWRDTRDATGLLATMDVVLNTHTLGGHGIMQALRKQNVKTYLGLHLVEKGPLGQPLGNPHIALAYEGAYDGFVVISEKLRNWCIGQAVPAEKVIKVLNAPSYEADSNLVTAALTQRLLVQDRALRVLYLGRLDAQKGLERLRDAITQTKGPSFEWRLVGKAVLNDTELDMSQTGLTIEPPAMTGHELDTLYSWADVVVLPSRFEGVPLTILEAQRFGCVVIATDVGAVSEIVDNNIDGFVVRVDQSEFGIIADFVSCLHHLAEDRVLLRRVSLAAAQRIASSSWTQNMQEWIMHIEETQGLAA
jgi:glycosyltransferase involved in cell wall biosynthesis